MRKSCILILLMAAVLVAGAVTIRGASRGVHVTVINAGPGAVSDLVVHVTGNSYAVGDLAPGESRTVRVRPTSESNAELEFVDSSSGLRRLDAGGYFEPRHYRGEIRIVLEAGAIQRTDNRVRISVY